MELGESVISRDALDNEINMNISQTDESKVAEQQTCSCTQQAAKPKVPCVADTGKDAIFFI